MCDYFEVKTYMFIDYIQKIKMTVLSEKSHPEEAIKYRRKGPECPKGGHRSILAGGLTTRRI